MTDSTTPLTAVRPSLLPVLFLSVALSAGCGGESAEPVVETVEDAAEDLGPIVPDVVDFEVDIPGPEEPDVELPPEPGEFGYPCDGNSECFSGFCIQSAKGRVCTRTCLEECPSGWDCRQSPGQDAIFVCLPRFIHLCDPCRESEQCNAAGQSGNFCIRDGDNGSFCGAACQEDEDCPGGYVCDDVRVTGGLEVRQCVPADGAECGCSPLAKARQSATDCAITNEHGSCGGTRFCLQQGLSDCDARTPFPESCNGMDDNCNGQTDELPPDYVCGITNEFGTCPGAGTCIDGVETCVGREPAPEICNGIDDNCDGLTDEGICDDGNPCTRDFCNADGTCVNVIDNSLSCDDGNFCTEVDRCQEGVCVGSQPRACDDGNPCTVDSCDPITGQCVHLPAPANTPCTTDMCTVGSFCDGAGSCVGGTPKVFVPKSQGGCIEEGGTFHEDCQSYDCTGAGLCIPKHHERRDFDCRIGSGTCSVGKCGTDGRCTSTVAPNTACTNPTNSGGTCRTPQCVGFECRNVDVAASAQVPCVVRNTCPPCARTLGFCVCQGDGPGVCGSGGVCVEQWNPNVDYCSSSACVGCQGICPNICGFYVCFQ